MTNVVVTEDGNRAVVTDIHTTVVTVQEAPRTIVTGMMGPAGSAKLSDAQDLDLSALGSGSLLVYNPNTQKWVATTILSQQIFESGQF